MRGDDHGCKNLNLTLTMQQGGCGRTMSLTERFDKGGAGGRSWFQKVEVNFDHACRTENEFSVFFEANMLYRWRNFKMSRF